MKKVTTIKATQGFDENGLSIKKKKVCAYCRVSTDNVEQLSSFNAQVRHYRELIENNLEWQFAGIYADEGISGKSKANRTDFLRMIKDAEKRKIDLVLTKSISRFARNTTDCIETVRLLKGWGVGVFFEKENINTLSAESELVLTILSSIAEEELMSMSQNIRWSNQKRFKEGKLHIVTERFMGYDRGEKGTLIINEEQAAIVRRIFKDYISGMGVTRLARALEADGIKNISGGTKWSPSVLLSMLQNEKYIGDAILQKTVTANNITFKRKVNEGESPQYYVKDNHPAIISREDFALVQEIRKERARGKGNTPETVEKFKNRYPFSQKIVCGHCGRSFRHIVRNTSSPSQQYYWGCANYMDRRVKNCDISPIKDETVRSLFVRVFNKLLTNGIILKNYARTLFQISEAKADGGRIKEIDSEIETLLKQEHIIFAVQEKGYADKAALLLEHNEIINKIGWLKEERILIMTQIDSQDDRYRKTKELIAFFEDFNTPIESFDEYLFETMVEKIVVKERECLVFHLSNGLKVEERYTFNYGDDTV